MLCRGQVCWENVSYYLVPLSKIPQAVTNVAILAAMLEIASMCISLVFKYNFSIRFSGVVIEVRDSDRVIQGWLLILEYRDA